MLWTQQGLPPIQADKFKIKPVIELRGRFERRLDRDQSNLANDDRSAFETRLRVGFDFTDEKDVSGKFRYQYAHSLRWAKTRNDSDESSDVYLAHVDFKTPNGSVSVGRQLLNYGDKVLLEESNSGQRSKSYDLIKFKHDQFEVFAGKVGYQGNRSDQARLLGASYRDATSETLAFFKSDRWVTDANFWTLDHYRKWSFNKFALRAEGALQRGKVGPRELDAWMLRGRAEYAATPKTSIFGEITAASGGADTNRTRGFDASYGTSHVLLGLVDVQGYRNVNALELGVRHKPDSSAEYLFSVLRFGLRDSRDGWYGTGGSINRGPGGPFIDPSGASGRDVGTEFNLMGKWKTRPGHELMVELGLFKPGGFVRAFTGASTRDQIWGLVTYTIKF